MVHKQRTTEGFALLLAIVIASILLAVGLTMLSITVKQLTLSSIARESEIAFHAAAAGMECIRYHRRENDTLQFTDAVTADGAAPVIDCFDQSSQSSDREDERAVNSDGYTNEFHYEFDWGDGGTARCSQVDLYVMMGIADSYVDDFSDVSAVIDDKTCPVGGACSVVIARGYNKSCTDLANGLATVEREITAQF